MGIGVGGADIRRRAVRIRFVTILSAMAARRIVRDVMLTKLYVTVLSLFVGSTWSRKKTRLGGFINRLRRRDMASREELQGAI